MILSIYIVLMIGVIQFYSSSTTMNVESFQPSTTTMLNTIITRSLPVQQPFTLDMVRRGKGSIGKEVVDGGSGRGSNNSGSTEGGSGIGGMGMGGSGESRRSSSAVTNINWTPIAVSVKSLPTEENKVTLIDTNLITMKNGQTNPTGAVSVIQYNKQTYCFAVNCPSCQIPLIKAKCIPGGGTDESNQQQPILQCDLCKATYNIQTGEKITSSSSNNAIGEKPGILGGIVKSLFASKASGPLKVYKLAEKNGKLLIAGLD